jgi:hypothetical protein
MFSSALLIEFSKELKRVPCSDVGTGKVLIQDMQITLLNFNSKTANRNAMEHFEKKSSHNVGGICSKIY